MTKQTHTLEHAGCSRSYFTLHSPQPRYAVFLLHPYASAGRAMASGGGWARHAHLTLCAPDALPLFPDKPAAMPSNGPIWTTHAPGLEWREGVVDDVAFLDEVLTRFLGTLDEDLPVFLAGHSSGADMTLRMLAHSQHRQRFAGAAVYGGLWGVKPAPIRGPLLYMAGEADRLRPLEGAFGLQADWGVLHSPPLRAVVDDCRAQLGLSELPAHVDMSAEHLTRMRWSHPGRPQAHLEYLLLHDQGHQWPGGRTNPPEWEAWMGPSNLALNATALAVDFFERCLERTPRQQEHA